MKKLITISCLLLVNLSNAQNIYELKIDKKMDINNRPTIDTNFDILRIEDYRDFIRHYAQDQVEIKYTKVLCEKEIELYGNTERGFVYIQKDKDYILVKHYDAKTLRAIRKFIVVGKMQMFIDKEYLFEPNGHLTKTIDHDKGWNFTYEDVINYLYKYFSGKIDSETMNFIKKKTYQGRNYWEIHTNSMIWEEDNFLRIDGNTGEILCHLLIQTREGSNNIYVLETIVPNKIDDLPKALIDIKQNKKYQTPAPKKSKHNGISYTEEEWKAYEEAEWQRYQKNKGKSWWERLFS